MNICSAEDLCRFVNGYVVNYEDLSTLSASNPSTLFWIGLTHLWTPIQPGIYQWKWSKSLNTDVISFSIPSTGLLSILLNTLLGNLFGPVYSQLDGLCVLFAFDNNQQIYKTVPCDLSSYTLNNPVYTACRTGTLPSQLGLSNGTFIFNGNVRNFDSNTQNQGCFQEYFRTTRVACSVLCKSAGEKCIKFFHNKKSSVCVIVQYYDSMLPISYSDFYPNQLWREYIYSI